ncbi:class I SAM-dependent methyltransferase [Desulfobotulus sp.]|jgi:SAM-dependent methyltransferase|uniref:class I SAM-dependent methyltransferase n=1 Tax=Desulfobotulus sp. TaxID=1940337 RepID=UPI002A36F223|nr:class I SAM-dependent methyltransferase [Desulfobotulus sp.]MDY0163528.1 class I SAM-dependent methyltransferase [Desulfobotulus sp.]
MEDTCRLYTDLAWLWPMWGDAATEYAPYCQHVTAQIRRHAKGPVHTLLDIGCGGGKNVFNLKREFRVTGLDLSPAMLAQAGELNPECAFVHGDMRTARLGKTFDAILMDDAISHMNCRKDFEAAFRTAFAHLNPGGVLVVAPDVMTETFRQNRTTVTPVLQDGLDLVIIENVNDPDPSDGQYETTILYLIREQGRLRIETDHWTMGIFPRETWKQVLGEAGFHVHEGLYSHGDDEYTVFTCVKNGP